MSDIWCLQGPVGGEQDLDVEARWSTFQWVYFMGALVLSPNHTVHSTEPISGHLSKIFDRITFSSLVSCRKFSTFHYIIALTLKWNKLLSFGYHNCLYRAHDLEHFSSIGWGQNLLWFVFDFLKYLGNFDHDRLRVIIRLSNNPLRDLMVCDNHACDVPKITCTNILCANIFM